MEDTLTNTSEMMSFASPFKSKDIMSISMSRYNTPQFTENTMKDWIMYGADNLYPNYLMEYLNKSATHAAIVQAKVAQIVGGGIDFIESEDKEQLAEIMKFIKRTNRYETMNDIIKKIAFDYVVFGGYALNLIWSKDRTSIAEIHHIDFSTLRVQKPNEVSEEVEGYYFSENWAQFQKPKFKPRLLAKFSTGNRIEPSQILYVKPYHPNTLFYPLPSYVGAMNYIELEYELSNYQLNSMKNGLSPSIMINFNNGQPTLQERQEIYSSIASNFTGTDNAGKFLLFFNKSKESAAEVTPIDINELDKLYTVMNESVVQNIMTAHRVTSPALLGIPSAGQLGTSQELILASELFFNQVIIPDQLTIEDTINKIFEINGWTLEIELTDIQPVSFTISEETMLKVLTIDEIRKKAGYDPLTDEQRLEIDNRNGTPIVPQVGDHPVTSPVVEAQSAEPIVTNDVLRSLSGRQHQGLLRIIKQVSSGKLSKEAGGILLSSGYGLNQEQIDTFLNDDIEEDMGIETSDKPYVDEIKKNDINKSK